MKTMTSEGIVVKYKYYLDKLNDVNGNKIQWEPGSLEEEKKSSGKKSTKKSGKKLRKKEADFDKSESKISSKSLKEGGGDDRGPSENRIPVAVKYKYYLSLIRDFNGKPLKWAQVDGTDEIYDVTIAMNRNDRRKWKSASTSSSGYFSDEQLSKKERTTCLHSSQVI
ncbi:unnamed protein product [Clavelina lepadiformis]|uniref:Uncharacterized protein n=1 Tax=Clavelina lepadiformis TaxID=159417 RepID=A0ABP0GB56_CLALP